MSTKLVEYIKVICLIIIAISLAIIAWSSMNQTELLEEIILKLQRISFNNGE